MNLTTTQAKTILAVSNCPGFSCLNLTFVQDDDSTVVVESEQYRDRVTVTIFRSGSDEVEQSYNWAAFRAAHGI